MPGIASNVHNTKNNTQPVSSTISPVTALAKERGSAASAVNSANWVAANVRLDSLAMKAVQRPRQRPAITKLKPLVPPIHQQPYLLNLMKNNMAVASRGMMTMLTLNVAGSRYDAHDCYGERR